MELCTTFQLMNLDKMDTLSQSSCEINKDLKELEICSQSDISSQDIKKQDNCSENSYSSTTESSQSSGLSSVTSSAVEAEGPIVKRKRRRRRKRNKKLTTVAYEEPRPFTARYKKLKLFEPSVLPKVHLRFDDFGDPDQNSSEYNLRPKIIQALTQNLLIGEMMNECKNKDEPRIDMKLKETFNEVANISLRPRIIKAIVV